MEAQEAARRANEGAEAAAADAHEALRGALEGGPAPSAARPSAGPLGFSELADLAASRIAVWRQNNPGCSDIQARAVPGLILHRLGRTIITHAPLPRKLTDPQHSSGRTPVRPVCRLLSIEPMLKSVDKFMLRKCLCTMMASMHCNLKKPSVLFLNRLLADRVAVRIPIHKLR